MPRRFEAVLLAVGVLVASSAYAQSGDASLRGFVKDDQGGVLPGVTVTATSVTLLAPKVVVTGNDGYYRLLNLPPGTYALKVELAGFSTHLQEGILMRAGVTFTVDVQLKIGTLSETVTVSGESPMIETGSPSSAINVDGDLVRAAPVTSRRLFSDVLDVTPGIGSRNVDDGVGRRAYYFRGSHIYAHAFQLEGMPASAYIDSAAHSMGMGGDTMQDVEVKLGGVDASTPLSTGVVMNVVAPRGQNALKGSVVYAFQPIGWNEDNTKGGAAPGGLPTFQSVNQWDVSVGGPIKRDKIWFYATLRYADLENGISRTETDLAFLNAFRPGFEPFNNSSTSKQPFVKLTTQLASGHELSGFWQNDRNRFTSSRERNTDLVNIRGTGGSMYQTRLSSVWTNRLTTTIAASFNNKGGADESTIADLVGGGPMVTVHQSTRISGGVPVGTGRLVDMNNVQTNAIQPSSMLVLRGDLTYYRDGWLGSHEFKTGIWAGPRLRRDETSLASNDGFIWEEVRQINPANPAAGTVPFHRRIESPVEITTVAARDRDIGVYVQDSWKPTGRLSVNIGVRADWVRRYDARFDIERMRSLNVGPRFGISYLVTEDARNVLRATLGRIHEQVNGRDPITTFATTSNRLRKDLYDANGDGTFETEVVTPAATAAINAFAFDPDLHQPFVDEWSLGFAKQFPGQISVDVSATQRHFKDGYGEIDINGIYPSGPNQPFGGFGRVDPNRGILRQETNNTWSKVVVTSFEAIVAKNLRNNFQVMTSLTRQFQKLDGTWNPTDPARFIQPDAFPSNRDLSQHLFGNGDDNTLDGGGRESGVAYRPYSIRMAGQYFAPWAFKVGASYVIQAGGYLGPVVILDRADSVFGPSRVTLANGTTQPNPLATAYRFAYATRSEGQARNETARYLQLNIGREIEIGRNRLSATLGIFNALNTGAHTQWNTGANVLNQANYLARFNRHPPRAYQLSLSYKF